MGKEIFKYILLFALFLFVGALGVFGFKFVNQKLSVEQLKSPLALTQFSLETAPSLSLRGKLTTVFGDVGWESRTATEPAKLTAPRLLQQGEQITTGDNGKATIDFPNLFSAVVYAKTKLDILQTLPAHIVLGQESGTVEYLQASGNSISIRTHGLLANIQNGNAIVTVSKTLPLITIVVKKGTVTVAYNDAQQISQLQSIDAGNELFFYTNTRKTIIKPVRL
ncbi:MAG: hypothetical protein HYT83_03805 [Candidatus Levybacteria bacterium]|nr:hypothetical protein [Candidatus Levybacteria bacterium]